MWNDDAQGVSSTALADALQQRDLSEWHQEALREAEQVEAGYRTRYVHVPEVDSQESYRDIEAFIAIVKNRHLQDRLWRAISGRGAFRYFKDVLLDYPSERIPDPTLADAILNRLVHNAYRLELKGDSMRKTNTPLP